MLSLRDLDLNSNELFTIKHGVTYDTHSTKCLWVDVLQVSHGWYGGRSTDNTGHHGESCRLVRHLPTGRRGSYVRDITTVQQRMSVYVRLINYFTPGM